MLRLLGVLPFAILPGYIPKLVFINGVLLHTQRLKSKDSSMYRILLWNDIICNICLYLCKYPHLLSTSDNFCYSIFFIVVRRKFRQRSKKVCFLPHIFCTVSFRILLFQTPSNLCVIFSLIKKKMRHKKLLPLRLELRTKAS